MTPPSDYDTVAAALRFLQEHFGHQPSLEETARAVGLSPHHFQRLFTRWAGVSPKRFLQFLTAQEAKERLRRSEPVLQAAFAAGLSGPARLHDLMIGVEAVTPGEFKARGAGVLLRWGIHPTPFGRVLLAASERGISYLSFLDGSPTSDRGASFTELADAWPEAELLESPAETATLARAIFQDRGDRPQDPLGPLSLFVKGTNFQIKVWSALLRVPPGALTTYGHLARALGQPHAARAVGRAVGANPIAYLIPCHRVIRQMGSVGEYRWGSVRKRALLGWEAAESSVSGPGVTSVA